jgi:hypothetical protein
MGSHLFTVLKYFLVQLQMLKAYYIKILKFQTVLTKSGSAGSRTRLSESVVKNSEH